VPRNRKGAVLKTGGSGNAKRSRKDWQCKAADLSLSALSSLALDESYASGRYSDVDSGAVSGKN